MRVLPSYVSYPWSIRRLRAGIQGNSSTEIRASGIATPSRRPQADALGVVITGSTRGLGYALAEEFARAGDHVVISSRRTEAVNSAVELLQKRVEGCAVTGYAADVSKADEVEALARHAATELKRVDVWICNAGQSTKRVLLAEVNSEDIASIVCTNLLGSLLCCKEAYRMMMQQEVPGGHIFVMEGAGSFGGATARMATYGCTKRALPQLVASLRKEVGKNAPVRYHALSPGMVLTSLLLSNGTTPLIRRIFNILAEEPTTVAEYLVPRVRDVAQNNRAGTAIRFLTISSVLWRLAGGFLFGCRKDRFFEESTGKRIGDGEFDSNGVRIVSKNPAQ